MKELSRFTNGQRVSVVNPDDEHEALRGKAGKVVRLLMRDNSAWVQMDESLPESLGRFPVDDSRANHVNLWPDECATEKP